MDVDGNDNTPEWGYCTHPGCRHEAFPIWFFGGEPDDPDLLLCPTHIGSWMNSAIVLLRACQARMNGVIVHHSAMNEIFELSKRIDAFLKEPQL